MTLTETTTLSVASATVLNRDLIDDMKGSVFALAFGLEHGNRELAAAALRNIRTQCGFISANLGGDLDE